MSLYIPASLRLFILTRSRYRCEYCLFPQTFAANPFEPDHIIPVQHGGQTVADNLATACFHCNRNKGPNVGSFDPITGILTPFFNPRLQRWQDHFELRDGEILPLTAEARVTIKILQLNAEERLAERSRLLQLGLFWQS